MTSLQNRLEPLGVALAQVTEHTYHYWRSAPKGVKKYIIWAEDGEQNSFNADNRKQRQGISGTIDFFTLEEYDALIDDIQDALQGIENLSWVLNSVQYEEETHFIHYEWSFYMR
jgi:hypothetical protein